MTPQSFFSIIRAGQARIEFRPNLPLGERKAKNSGLRVRAGYGLALLLVFIASTVLIGASLSMLLGPGASSYLGSGSRDAAAAKQVALIALEAAQNDIVSKLSSGTSVTTSYRYPTSSTNSITMPIAPGIGSTVTVGNYYVTVVKARGYTYMLEVNATVNNSAIVMDKLVQLHKTLTIPENSMVAYSLRRLYPNYNGSAVQVRCAYTGQTNTIGFNGSGDFDLASYRSCLGDSTLPLDNGTNAAVAYSLRRLRSAYSGSAIRVRSSASGSPEQDIGFDANGNLDTQTLMSFIGSNSGYVKTWYDQSGHGKDLTQSIAAKQPRLVNAGVIDTKNSVPAIYFDGSSDFMNNTSLGGTLITGSQLRSFLVSSVESGSNTWGRFAVLWKSSDTNAYTTASSIELLLSVGSLDTTGTHLNNDNADANGLTTGTLYQHASYHDASNNLRLYRNGALSSSASISANLSPTDLIIGTGAGPDAGVYSKTYINELIIFNANLSLATQQAIERNEGHYFNINGMQDGFVTTWYDQSGNARNAVQATAAKQPAIAQVGILTASGKLKPAIQFDGSDNYLSVAASAAWPSANTDRTLSTVYKLSLLGSNGTLFGWGSIGDGQCSYVFYNTGSPGSIGLWGFNADVNAHTGNDANVGHRTTLVHTSGTMNAYVDGTVRASGTPSLVTPSNTALTIGIAASNWNIFTGNIAEAIAYDTALNATKRTQLDTSQSNYYGQ